MKIIVAGCGKVGKAVIESMVAEMHDVVAIDTDPQVIESITNTYDVMAVCGSATSREMLIQAEVSKTDLFIATTEADAVNMLACFLASRLGAKYTVARVREAEYDEDGTQTLGKELGLSMTINPERLTAEALFDILKLPSAVNVNNFAGKKIRLLELVVKDNSPLSSKTLQDLRKKSVVPFVACVVRRGEEVYIPTGEFCLQAEDKVAFMVKSNDTHKFLRSVGLGQKQSRDVMILGGSSVAFYLAKMLASNGFNAKIIEKDADKSDKIAEMLLSAATVICGDGLNQELLWEEGIKVVDAFVALTGNDEENILISFYATSEQVPKVITKVSHTDKSALAEKLGLDSIVSPQKFVANILTQYARALSNTMTSKIETMYSLMDGKAEALEFDVLTDCELNGTKLKDMNIKPNFIIAGIIRDKETLIPSGDDCFVAGDKVIVVAADESVHDLTDIVR